MARAADLLAEAQESGACRLTQTLLICGWRRGIADRVRASVRGSGRGVESDLANVEVFFEAIELEKVEEFECADITATGTDFLLQIAHDAPEFLRSEADAQELEPEPLTIIAQGELLAGELAVETMDVLYGSGDFVVRHKGSLCCGLSHYFPRAMAVSQGSRSRAFWTWEALMEVLAARAASSMARWAR